MQPSKAVADARDKYDAMVQTEIASSLAKRGFKRNRQAFSRFEDAAWQIVGFQASQFGSRNDVRFTVNLAVAYLAARDDTEEWGQERPPSEPKAHVRVRIGELLPSREDTWWTVDEQTDTAALSKELLRLLDSKAIAWLESRATIDDLVSSLRRDPKGISSYELAHMQKALLNAGEFAAADLVREEQRRRHPGRTD